MGGDSPCGQSLGEGALNSDQAPGEKRWAMFSGMASVLASPWHAEQSGMDRGPPRGSMARTSDCCDLG